MGGPRLVAGKTDRKRLMAHRSDSHITACVNSHLIVAGAIAVKSELVAEEASNGPRRRR